LFKKVCGCKLDFQMLTIFILLKECVRRGINRKTMFDSIENQVN